MNDWLQSLLRAPFANGDTPLSRPTLWAGLVCLAWAGGIALWCAARLRRRLLAKRSFIGRAAEAGFDRAEAQVLWTLGRHAENGRREAILESPEAFDQCVRAAEQAAGGDPVVQPEYLSGSVTGALRRRFSRARADRARHHIAGTREIELNQLVNVRLGDGPVFKAFTLSVSERDLGLSLPKDVPAPRPMEPGQQVFLSFWRPHDARYECASQATIEAMPEGRRLAVAHAPLNRVQEREHVRVRCRQEVRLGVAGPAEGETPVELPFVAMLRDISNGGASFVTDRRLAPGSRVFLRLKLLRKPGALTVSGCVLRQTLLEGTSNPLWANSVQFDELSGRAEHQLSRFIADLQQRLISRLLSRVGVEEEPAPQPAVAGNARAPASASLSAREAARQAVGEAGRESRSPARSAAGIPVAASGVPGQETHR